MPCTSPLAGYKNPDGSTSFGARKNTLGRFGLRTFRCGVCMDCRLYRAREWAIRMYHESTLFPDNCFVDLTFRDDPGSVSKRDTTLFFKALRNHTGAKLRYAVVGEYGEQFSRPHYHACIFGWNPDDKYPWKRSKRGTLLYRSPVLEKAWTHGNVTVSDLSMEAAGYTARYTTKKITGDLQDEHYRRDFNGVEISVTPEFLLTSKRPALGLRWIEKNWRDVFGATRDHVIYKGKECPIPRYYQKWLKENQPDESVKFEERNKQRFDQQTPTTGERLHFEAKATRSRCKSLVRPYESGEGLSPGGLPGDRLKHR